MPDVTDAVPSGPRGLPSRLLARRDGRAAALVLLALPVVLVGGVRVVDADLPGYLSALARGAAAVPADRGFLLEGLLTDALGAGLSRLGVPEGALGLVWWGTGVALLLAVLALSVGRDELAYRDLLLLVAFSHLVDTLSAWVGKFDPWLMAFLVVSAWRRTGSAAAGSALAALCHPILALLSTAGVAAVDLALAGRLRVAQVGLALAVGAADLLTVHRALPDLVDRTGYAVGLAAGLLHDAALMGPPTLVSAALVPFALIRRFAGPFRFGGRRGAALTGAWALAAVSVGCVATLDHTRVLCLLTLAPAVAFLRHQDRGASPERWDRGLFALLFLCRLALPQIDGGGAVAATPYPLAPWRDPPARREAGSLQGSDGFPARSGRPRLIATRNRGASGSGSDCSRDPA